MGEQAELEGASSWWMNGIGGGSRNEEFERSYIGSMQNVQTGLVLVRQYGNSPAFRESGMYIKVSVLGSSCRLQIFDKNRIVHGYW